MLEIAAGVVALAVAVAVVAAGVALVGMRVSSCSPAARRAPRRRRAAADVNVAL
jgi:hypothetical protein